MIEKIIKKEYPIINKKEFVYLDSACSALKMSSAIKAQYNFLENYGGCGGNRSSHIISANVARLYEKSRYIIANFIGASYDEIIFTSGTTESFNILANSFSFDKGDEIIISGLEHNSVFLPFYKIAKEKNLGFKIIPIKDFQPDINKFKKLITPKTKVLCITKASNFSGGSVNTDEIIEIAKRNNIKVFMDVAQYIPTHKVNVKNLNIDALAFSGHKLGAPYGIGVLYVKNDLYPLLKPFKVGGGIIKEIKETKNNIIVEFLDKYNAFEAGISNYAGAYALSKTVEKIEEISYELIRNHISILVEYAVYKLNKEIKDIRIIGSNITDGSIVSFNINRKKFSHYDFSIFISSYNPPIAIRTGKLCADIASIKSRIEYVVRISFYIYNTQKDIDIFINGLKKYLELIE